MGEIMNKKDHQTIEMQKHYANDQFHDVKERAKSVCPCSNPTSNMHSFQPNPNCPDWREYMMNEIRKADPAAAALTCADQGLLRIPPVPEALFEVKPSSYTPRVVNIGPLSPKPVRPSPMDRCKALCVRKFMARHGISDVDELVKHVVPDPRVLAYIYSNLVTYHYPNLRLLVTVDAVFLHEFFLFVHDGSTCQDKRSGYLHTFFNNGITRYEVRRDLLLVGNQVPKSFLKKIREFPKKPDVDDVEFSNMLVDFTYFTHIFFSSKSSQENQKPWIFPEVLKCQHLLDCVYVSCTHNKGIAAQETASRQAERSKDEEDSGKRGEKKIFSYHFPTASQLFKAGIRLKAMDGNVSIIKYHKAKLQLDLPRLVVFDNTEDVLRNLLAHEQTSARANGGTLTMYAVLMDALIDGPKDLAILSKAQVITNHLGSDERLVQMWNDMCINIMAIPCPGSWEQMSDDVWKHCLSRRRRWQVEFLSTYFSRPWYWIPIFVGFLLLIFSTLQTVYAVLTYYQPSHNKS